MNTWLPVVGLADDIALEGRPNQLEHLDRIETPALEVGFAQTDRELRQAGRRLNQDLGRTRDFAEDPSDFLRLCVEEVEIIAEDVDHHRRGVARERLFDALGKKRHDRGVHADEAGEGSADVRLGGCGLVPREARLQSDLELAVMGAPGVFRLLRAPRPLGNRAHGRHPSQGIGDARPDAQRFVERGTGHRRDVNDEMPFLELGDKGAAKEGQRGTTGYREEGRCDDQRPRPARDFSEQALVARS